MLCCSLLYKADADLFVSGSAPLWFCSADAVNIPVSGINIGPVHKRDVLRANVMNERGHKKYACILCFDVAVTKEAREMAQEFNVRIFTADIIYHLFDQVRSRLSCALGCVSSLQLQHAAQIMSILHVLLQTTDAQAAYVCCRW